MCLNKTRRYTLRNRLSDVIRLITVLSLDKDTFRTEQGLQRALGGQPLSLKTWHKLAVEHPEFFRPILNEKEHYALVIRSYLPKDANNVREPLTIEQTQKLIDVAIALHEKEIQQRQMNSHVFPIVVAVIAVLGTIFTAIYTNSSHDSTSKKIDSLNASLQRIELKIGNH